jgi:chromosome segregation ATPase
MKTFELKTVDQNPEVVSVKNSIKELKHSIASLEHERKTLSDKVNETSQSYQDALTQHGLGKGDKQGIASFEVAMRESQNRLHKFDSTNNPGFMAAKKQALSNLEAELLAAEDLAKDKLMSEMDEFIETQRVELQEPIKKIKEAIKILHDVLKQKKNSSPQSTLTFKYNFPFDNLTMIYNYLRCLEYLGTDKIDSDFVQTVDTKFRFLD